MREPQPYRWTRALLNSGGRSVSVAWERAVTQGLHSIDVVYDPDVVRIRIRMGTRPSFWGLSGLVAMNMIVEHTVVPLREPLRGRRLEVLA